MKNEKGLNLEKKKKKKKKTVHLPLLYHLKNLFLIS